MLGGKLFSIEGGARLEGFSLSEVDLAAHPSITFYWQPPDKNSVSGSPDLSLSAFLKHFGIFSRWAAP